MISSPCKKCALRNQPKDVCAKDCALLDAVQEIGRSMGADVGGPGIDYAEESRFTLGIASIKTPGAF